MAVKTSMSITLSFMKDVKATYRYYKLQSSTASKPSVPTTKPETTPSGWSDSEPSYTSGSTNTLYFVDATLFSDETFLYTPVSKSSSYEAAKEAYNKATNAQTAASNAQTTANTVQANLDSYKKNNLVRNGYGEEKNNTNFSKWIFDGSETYNNAPSFKYTGANIDIEITNEYIPIDITNVYEVNLNYKTNQSVKYYIYADQYDIDKKQISATYQYAYKSSTTTLAQELKNGDTVVYLTYMSNGWSVSSSTPTHQLGLIFWNYKDSTGYQYPEGVYSRNAWTNLYTYDKVNTTAKTITLKSAWTNGTFPAGTKVSRSNSAGHNYFVSNANTPTEWENIGVIIKDIGDLYSFRDKTFNPACKYLKLGMLHNYSNVGSASTTSYINSISVVEKTLENDMGLQFEDTNERIDDAEERVSEAEATIKTLEGCISMLVVDENGESLMNYNSTSATWQFSTKSIDDQFTAAQNSLNNLTTRTGSVENTVTALQAAVNKLSPTGEYISIGTFENEPCIILGESDSDFKVLITNTRILFSNGNDVPTHVNTYGLVTKKIEVQDELRHTNSTGQFIWKMRTNGNYGLMWKEAD